MGNKIERKMRTSIEWKDTRERGNNGSDKKKDWGK